MYDQFVVRFGEHRLGQLKLKHSNYTEILSSKSRKTVIPALRQGHRENGRAPVKILQFLHTLYISGPHKLPLLGPHSISGPGKNYRLSPPLYGPALRAQKSCSNGTKNWAGSNFKPLWQECFFSDIYSLFEKYKKQVRTCRTYPKLPRFTVNRIVFSNFTFQYLIFSLPWSASIVTEKPFTKPLKI